MSRFSCAVRCAFALAFGVGLPGCGADDEVLGPVEPTEVSFAEGFLFGTATAGFQIEKGLPNTDWGIWAATPGKILNGDLPDDGPDALAHIAEDVARMKAAGLNAYRFSLELARLYPTRAAFDADEPDPGGLASYDALFAALAGAGITPMVTLHHFAWPDYLSDPSKNDEPQGFERDDTVAVFEAWCSRMGDRYGASADLWVTINEPMVEASVGYLAGLFAPGVSDVERMAGVLRKQVVAHARCFDALHATDLADADGDGKAALVSIAKHDRVYEPADPASEYDVAAAAHSRYFWNEWFVAAIIRGDLDDDFDGVPEKTADPAFVGRADYFGLNYYGVSRIAAGALKLPYLGVLPSQLDLPNDRPKNDLGWDIFARGFGTVIDEAAAHGLPIYVTENGIADAEDRNRSRYLAEHLFELGKASLRGADVRGYMHWSFLDNFEWASGFCPRFGLFRVDFEALDKPRTPTAALALYTEIASARALTAARVAALPAYSSKPHPCATF
ncbi:MAG: glycoside hydrolase family 1 protein [Myxococcales bacterium]|nr:glycoside hydrolase family 1 protein [Myxococcales bacterium]